MSGEELKPAAWMYEIPGTGVWRLYRTRYVSPQAVAEGWTETPLYAAPQPDMGSGKTREVRDHLAAIYNTWRDQSPSFPIDITLGQLKEILAALSPPASQSVEKLISAAQRVLDRGYVSEHIEEERADYLALKEALSTLPHKEEATPPPVGEQGAVDHVAELANFIAREKTKGLIDFNLTTGNDASDPQEVARIALAMLNYATPATTERGRG